MLLRERWHRSGGRSWHATREFYRSATGAEKPAPESDAVLSFFDWEAKDYRKIPVNEQVEVVSLLGDVALGPNEKPALHPHVVSRADGSAMGVHLLEAHIRPTLEVVLTESPGTCTSGRIPTAGSP